MDTFCVRAGAAFLAPTTGQHHSRVSAAVRVDSPAVCHDTHTHTHTGTNTVPSRLCFAAVSSRKCAERLLFRSFHATAIICRVMARRLLVDTNEQTHARTQKADHRGAFNTKTQAFNTVTNITINCSSWHPIDNDERRTTNDGRRTTNDERRTTNDERRTTDDGRRTTDDERTTNDGRRTTNDERRTPNAVDFASSLSAYSTSFHSA